MDGIKLKDNDKGYYTDASYKAYSDAYKALKKLAAAGEGEVGIAEFTEAKERSKPPRPSLPTSPRTTARSMTCSPRSPRT